VNYFDCKNPAKATFAAMSKFISLIWFGNKLVRESDAKGVALDVIFCKISSIISEAFFLLILLLH